MADLESRMRNAAQPDLRKHESRPIVSLRRIRFRLATLLIGMTLLCVVLAVPKWYVFQRSQARQYIEGLGGRVEFEREFVNRISEAEGRRKRETLLGLGAILDFRTDDEAYIIAVDLHNVEQLPPIDELAGSRSEFTATRSKRGLALKTKQSPP